MKIITAIHTIQTTIQQLKQKGQTIGFVPTMGFLHEGHLSLVKKAREENDIVVMSIFVNPLQFGENEDFTSYPRDEVRDEKLARDAGVDLLFMPKAEEMYKANPSFKLTVTNRVDVLCGESRPGHFDGVATVLIKLLHLTLPNRVYFGLKDAQQVAVVTALIDEFNFPLELVAVPTTRESDGLAKSSRNVYLTDGEREQAVWLNRSLIDARKMITNGGRNPDWITKEVEKTIGQHTNGEIDYIKILNYPDLEQIETIDGIVIIALAVKFSKARLIDNLIVKVSGNEVVDYVSHNDEW